MSGERRKVINKNTSTKDNNSAASSFNYKVTLRNINQNDERQSFFAFAFPSSLPL